MRRAARIILAVGILLTSALTGQCIIRFSDNFDQGPSFLWANESGSWTATGGVYFATAPNNFPSAYSSLPYIVDGFSIELDINNTQDGGVWLHSQAAPGTSIGVTGVLLVTKPSSNGLYWHIVENGNDYGPILNETPGIISEGST